MPAQEDWAYETGSTANFPLARVAVESLPPPSCGSGGGPSGDKPFVFVLFRHGDTAPTAVGQEEESFSLGLRSITTRPVLDINAHAIPVEQPHAHKPRSVRHVDIDILGLTVQEHRDAMDVKGRLTAIGQDRSASGHERQSQFAPKARTCSQSADPQFEDGSVYRTRWWTTATLESRYIPPERGARSHRQGWECGLWGNQGSPSEPPRSLHPQKTRPCSAVRNASHRQRASMLFGHFSMLDASSGTCHP